MNILSNFASYAGYNQVPLQDPDECKDTVQSAASPNFDKEQKPATSNSSVDENGYKIMEFFTDYGTQRAFIDGDLKSGKPIIITYHDIGINHNACYLSFFNMMKSYDVKWKYFTIIHIDAPQHHHNDKEKETEHGPPQFFHDPNIAAYDLLELCTQIEEIRSALHIENFIAFGIGAACNVWSYYAINYSHRLRGMILLNGVADVCSWKEWIFDSLLSTVGTTSQFLRDSFHSSLMLRFFPRAVSQEINDYFWSEFDRIDIDSAIKYFRGFARRQALSALQLSKIKCKTLILCGEFSRVKDETIKFQSKMPRHCTTFVLIDKTGFLLTESHPQKLCSSVDLFTTALGLTKISLESAFGKMEEEEYADI